MGSLVILNPYANRWNALRRRPDAEESLRKAGVDFEIIQTEHPGHGIEIAKEGVKRGFQKLIAMGGDSTVNEVINGIMATTTSIENSPSLGVIPMGTANDLADNLGISKELDQAATIISQGYTKPLDVCRINDRYFVNNSGVGLEPTITTIQMEIHRVQGIIRYLLATFIGIYRKPEWQMEIHWDEGEFNGPVTLVSVGNSPRTGGLFFLTPHANAFDGKLTFLVGYAPTRFQLVRLLPKAMRSGNGNVSEDERTFEKHTTKLQLKLKNPSPVHADGEVFDREAMEISYSIIPARIPILLSDQQSEKSE